MTRCQPSHAAGAHRLVGDPIDAVTGAQVEDAFEFALPGPVPFEWRRHYDSSRVGVLRALGWGHSHGHDRALVFDVDGLRHVGPLGDVVAFPALAADGARASGGGITLRRLSALRYRIDRAGQPSAEFEFADPRRPAPLSALVSDGGRVGFRYRGDGALEGVATSDGRYVHVDCDAAGRVLRLVLTAADRRHDRVLVAYEYDAAGDLARGVDAYRHGFSFAYDASHRMTRRTDRRGYTFHFAHDEAGRCVRAGGEDGLQEVRLEYRPDERRTLVTQADGGVWEYRYDEASLLTGIADPYGGVRAFRYDAEGNVADETDPNGDVTRWVYDAAGAFLGKRSSLGHFSADPEGPCRPDQLAHRIPARPSEWEYGDLLTPHLRDDGATRVPRGVAAGLPAPAARLLPYVLGGDPAALAAPAPAVAYDEFGRRLREERPNGAARRWGYDAGGNTVSYRDADGAVTRCEYSSWDLATRRTDPLGRAVLRGYTRSARVAQVVDAGGVERAYRYDLKGRVVEFWYAGACLERYQYDDADNLTAVCDGAGRAVLSQAVGGHNLRTARRLASGETHRFAYTPRGQYAEVAADDVVVTFEYDMFANRTLDARDGRGVRHRFSGPGALAETTVLGRFVSRYAWTAEGVLEVRDPGGHTHVLRFPGAGVAVRQMSGGLVEVARYDAEGRCAAKASARERWPGSAVPWVRGYRYSGEGDLVLADDSASGPTRYAYDGAHRLTAAGGARGPALAFRHDAADNLVEQPGLGGVTFAAGHRLRTANGDAFEYDDRGNLAARRGARGTTRYRYDSRNMLVECETPGGVFRAAYDALGRRVRKSFNDTWREFFWDTDRLAAELAQDGRLRVYVYADAFAVVPLLWLDYAHADDAAAAGRRYFVACDHRGAPTRVEDEAGRVVWRARVAPYGGALVVEGAEFEMPLRLPGHYYDAEIGLHYNRFRYYSPELGRYLQPDPLVAVSEQNAYAYATNPLRAVDLRGDCETDGTTPPAAQTAEDGTPAKRPPTQLAFWAFPGLTRGGGRTNEHAQRAVDAMRGMSNSKMRKNRSVTVIEHENGNVSVGLSGNDPKRREQTQRLVDALNAEEAAAGRRPIYRTAEQDVDASVLTPGPQGSAPAGTCSEAQAAQAAGQPPLPGQASSPPRNYQTVWSGPKPQDHTLPGNPTTSVGPNPAPQMQPCNTCRCNADQYSQVMSGGSPGAGSPGAGSAP